MLGCFVVGVVLRSIPEVLAYPYPISWDMMHYAYFMKVGVIWPQWTSFFTSTWLLYGFLFPLHSSLGVDSFLLLKTVGPLLYGLNVCGVYWFARSFLNWSTRSSLAAGAFFSVQLAALRVSAEFLRNTLGLTLMLFTLPLIKRMDSRRGFAGFTILALLTVFAHEYAAITLLAVTMVVALRRVMGRKSAETVRQTKKLVLAIIPALLVFAVGVYLRMFSLGQVDLPRVGPNVVWVDDIVYETRGITFFFVNYLGMNTGLEFYPSFLHLALDVVVLFALLYLSYIYLAWKGSFRNEGLDIWTGLLLLGSFSCLVVPFFAVDFWHRWMFMLAYPFTFYAVNWMKKMFSQTSANVSVFPRWNKATGTLLATSLLGAAFLVTPFLMVNVGFGIYSLYPACKYFGSAPTVPYQDISGTVSAMCWLRDNLQNDSCAVLHNAFATWGRLYLEGNQDIVAYKLDVSMAVDQALQKGYKDVYFVSWNVDVGWYGVSVPEDFIELEGFDRISVFKYAG